MHDRLLAATDVARAVERQEQELHYQPIVSLDTGRIDAFEALVRWRHPERGLLGPDELIPACEASGLILPLGEWILRRASLQAIAWRRSAAGSRLRVGVNLSGLQLAAPELLGELDEVASDTGVEPSSIVLELTEDVLFETPNSIALLWRLRRRGFRLQLDDFGTGYTCLRELHRSPVEALKIDRAFVARMKPGGEDIEVVRAVAGLGRGLGLAVVAKGVETAQQLDQVRDLGLTHAQGFLFSRPLSARAATDLIARNPRW